MSFCCYLYGPQNSAVMLTRSYARVVLSQVLEDCKMFAFFGSSFLLTEDNNSNKLLTNTNSQKAMTRLTIDMYSFISKY